MKFFSKVFLKLSWVALLGCTRLLGRTGGVFLWRSVCRVACVAAYVAMFYERVTVIFFSLCTCSAGCSCWGV